VLQRIAVRVQPFNEVDQVIKSNLRGRYTSTVGCHRAFSQPSVDRCRRGTRRRCGAC
jgi:hypothetical protein